jgi:hypothetical protein
MAGSVVEREVGAEIGGYVTGEPVLGEAVAVDVEQALRALRILAGRGAEPVDRASSGEERVAPGSEAAVAVAEPHEPLEPAGGRADDRVEDAVAVEV